MYVVESVFKPIYFSKAFKGYFSIHSMDVIELAKALISINTVDSANGKKVVEVIDSALEGLPYKRELYTYEGVVNAFYYPAYECAELFAFNGHYDVVPADDWNKAFEPEEKDGFLYGRGSADMKGGLAAMTLAFAELLKEKRCASLFVVGDEEKGGAKGTGAALKDVLKKHKIRRALIGEPMQESKVFGDTVKVGRRGVFWLKLRIKGKGGHASQSLPYNPSRYIAHVLDMGANLTNKEGMAPTTVNITSLSMPLSAYNTVPSTLELTLDIRMNHGTSREAILHYLYKDGYEVDIEELFYAAPFFNPDKEYAEAVLTFLSSKGYKPKSSTAGGSSDARFFSSAGIGVVEFGPRSFNAHGRDERVSVDELRALVPLYKRIAEL